MGQKYQETTRCRNRQKSSAYLKLRIFNQCILPTRNYTAEIWSLNETMMEKLLITHYIKENGMINAWVEWTWTGHFMRTGGKRWAKKVKKGQSRLIKSNPRRVTKRWKDDIQKAARIQWMTKTTMMCEWRILHYRRSLYPELKPTKKIIISLISSAARRIDHNNIRFIKPLLSGKDSPKLCWT